MCIHCAGQLKRRMIVYAIHSHRPGADDELSFDVGDMIEVIREPGPSDWWCTGRIMNSLDEGLFPVNYVDRTGPKGSSGDLSETTYQALCVDTLNDNQDGDIYKSKEVVTQLLYLTAVALYVVQKGKAPRTVSACSQIAMHVCSWSEYRIMESMQILPDRTF